MRFSNLRVIRLAVRVERFIIFSVERVELGLVLPLEVFLILLEVVATVAHLAAAATALFDLEAAAVDTAAGGGEAEDEDQQAADDDHGVDEDHADTFA